MAETTYNCGSFWVGGVWIPQWTCTLSEYKWEFSQFDLVRKVNQIYDRIDRNIDSIYQKIITDSNRVVAEITQIIVDNTNIIINEINSFMGSLESLLEGILTGFMENIQSYFTEMELMLEGNFDNIVNVIEYNVELLTQQHNDIYDIIYVDILDSLADIHSNLSFVGDEIIASIEEGIIVRLMRLETNIGLMQLDIKKYINDRISNLSSQISRQVSQAYDAANLIVNLEK